MSVTPPADSGPDRTIWLTRHGMRQDFVDPRWREDAPRPHDTPLSSHGIVQAQETAAFLADKQVEVIYTSPFLRTVETAGEIAAILQVPIRIEHGLCEALQAQWFASPPDYIDPRELHRRYRAIDLTYHSRVEPVYPESEADGDVGRRCQLAVRAMLQDDWRCALWVGHGASVGGIGWALTGHVHDVCFKMCGLTGWHGRDGQWQAIHSGTDHLSVTEESLRFH